MKYIKKTALEKKQKKNKQFVQEPAFKKKVVVLSAKTESELQFFTLRKNLRVEAKNRRRLVLEKHLPEDKKSLWKCTHCNEHKAVLIKAVQSRAIDEGQVYDLRCKNTSCLKTFRLH